MQVDILGLENVVSYIQATKLSKFIIQRAGANAQAIPVFECIDSDSNSNAINEFSKWAAVMNNSIPYKITLFDFALIKQDENGQVKIEKSKNKSGKSEVTFVINTAMQTPTTNQQQNTMGFDLAGLRADIIKDISKQQEDNAILAEIKRLSSRLDELDADEEEEEEESSGPGGLGGLDATQLQSIMGLVNMFKTPTQPTQINGVEEVKENINKAIKILYKHDKSLDTDLLKLADLAENKPDTFKMLLETLRKF